MCTLQLWSYRVFPCRCRNNWLSQHPFLALVEARASAHAPGLESAPSPKGPTAISHGCTSWRRGACLFPRAPVCRQCTARTWPRFLARQDCIRCTSRSLSHRTSLVPLPLYASSPRAWCLLSVCFYARDSSHGDYTTILPEYHAVFVKWSLVLLLMKRIRIPQTRELPYRASV